MHLASQNGHVQIVNFLLEKIKEHNLTETMINSPNLKGATPLLLVCARGYGLRRSAVKETLNRQQIVKLLHNNGVDLNLSHSISKQTPLHWAASNQDFDLIKLLLELGADPLKMDV